jgi:cytidine deaminase
MENRILQLEYQKFETIADLPLEEQLVLQQAIEARATAYAPYSGFKVGAAVKLENQKIVTGSNQENAAYPSGLCAERVAMFAAGAQFPDIPFEILAITASNPKGQPVTNPVGSCGACRQVIFEYFERFQKPFITLLFGETGPIFRIENPGFFLPLSFTKDALK